MVPLVKAGLQTPPRMQKFWTDDCHNLRLGLATKARACKGVGQEGSLEDTFHAMGSVGECARMNFYGPKGTPILEIGVPMDF